MNYETDDITEDFDSPGEDGVEFITDAENTFDTCEDTEHHELHEAAAEFLQESTDGQVEATEETLDATHELTEQIGNEELESWLQKEAQDDLQSTLDNIER